MTNLRHLPTISVVGCHAEGEVGDVIIGGVEDVDGDTMFEKLENFQKQNDHIRHLLLNEPRGRASLNLNVILPPCNPVADIGVLMMGNETYAFMSGSNAMCVTTVLLETGKVPMLEPETKLTLDTAAGPVTVTAQCEAGKCKSVALDNIPAFVAKLDMPVDVPGVGTVSVDVAWGGMWYGVVAAESLGLKVSSNHCPKLIKIGDRVTKAIQNQFRPVHPENPDMAGVCTVSITEPVSYESGCLTGKHTVIIPPSRCDRSPCGTGTSARMAILYARGLLKVGETFKHRSVIDTEFIGRIQRTTKVGEYDAIVPNISGRAWITSYKQIVLDPADPYPEGFRVGDQWPTEEHDGESSLT
ncbi:hypothetical protein QQS21_012566 [Conoideocrella luteorostrata]|uniref:Proline racemase n=1 Tax=Conoideocrella luteorostrata TaxID=1105319 RepID=A0AAJ0FSC5_9HYPO|nr:hypothetical protein QQS21_012566 [Conoideocrella luteorostrata]